METINKAGLAIAAAPGRLDYPRHTLTLIVKGSFDMRPGEPLHLKGPDDQSPPGDARLVTDSDGVLWTTPSDLAYAKVQGEILVRSSCYDVGQTPRTVTLEVADKIRKALSVVGRRTAVVQAGTEPQVSLPEPARRVPIRYELAYGGPDYPHNPIGRGHLAESPSTAWALDLPCIEAFPTTPDNGSDADDRSVAGFGPIAGGWEPRVSKIGTRDAKWQADRAPWLPEDFDWSFFNEAPADQQLRETFFAGNETIRLTHQHPTVIDYRVSLPSIRPRCFAEGRYFDNPFFLEIPVSLDTVYLDMESEQATLVLRGTFVVDAADCSGVDYILLDREALGEPEKPLAQYQVDLSAAKITETTDTATLDAELAKLEAQLSDAMDQIDFDSLPPELREAFTGGGDALQLFGRIHDTLKKTLKGAGIDVPD